MRPLGTSIVRTTVRSEDGREILIPALRSVVREIDVPGGRMTVRFPQ